MGPPVIHQPVLVEEVLRALALKPGAVVLDATVGMGGHAEAILQRIGPKGRLIAADRDPEAIDLARTRLQRFEEQVIWVRGHFGELARFLQEAGVEGLDAALFDLGVSSWQLEQGRRGFSFNREGPLDMRMDLEAGGTAAEIVNRASLPDLERMLRLYGQERWAGRIARAIVRARPLQTTVALAEVVRRAVPAAARRGRIDPATRTFQAIRIAVNEELDLLPQGLEQAVQRLKPSGRIAVLAYHSLEDRIVKLCFREQAKAGILRLLTPKPIRPTAEEVARNPRSRSACLRAAEVVG